jgi:hypothetical protein
MYLVNPDEVNVMPEQNAPEERVGEEIEMEKAVSSPLKNIQAEPSGSTKEDGKVEGEQVASRGNTIRSPHMVPLPRWWLTLLLVLWLHSQNRKKRNLKSPWLMRRKMKKLHH